MLSPHFKNISISTSTKVLHCDSFDVINAFSAVRDEYVHAFLFEYKDKTNGGARISVIGAVPLLGIEVTDLHKGFIYMPGENAVPIDVSGKQKPNLQPVYSFYNELLKVTSGEILPDNGLYGYCSYNAVQLHERIKFNNYKSDKTEIPLLKYDVYRFLAVYNHNSHQLRLIHNHTLKVNKDEINPFENILLNPCESDKNFEMLDGIETDMTAEKFLSHTGKAINHCLRGNVFQLVLSRRFQSRYRGNLLEVFRHLRSANPSPYQFFFDYNGFELLGTSPEAQFIVKNNEAVINPIAGTYRRTGEFDKDRKLALKLLEDKKESSEHIMLVDLARNDLSKFSKDVTVTSFKKIEFYSQLMHIVSEVKGRIEENYQPFDLLLSNLPAGTLSGAPKYKAMQLIDELESSSRSFYGGCIGFISFQKEINTAILIRSLLAKDGEIYFRAGAGIVESSNPESELNEIDNKLRALTLALTVAEVKQGMGSPISYQL